jgi:hypothetical protein
MATGKKRAVSIECRGRFSRTRGQFKEQAMNDDEMIPRSNQKGKGALWGAVVILISATVISLGYALYQRNVTASLSTANQDAETKLAETGRQVQMLSQKLNKLEASEAATAHPKALPTLRASAKTFHARRTKIDRYNKLETQLAEHQKEIDSTQQALNSTRSEFANNLDSAKTELGGSIARTHAELAALEKKGQRNYYEFDVAKSKHFNRTGPMGIRLRKANTKHEYADLELIVDDREVTKKHVNIYEPVVFYPADGQPPIQLVINGIHKNLIRGYVSTPKYTASDLSSAGSSADTTDAAATGAVGMGKVNRNAGSPAAPAAQPATPVELSHRPAVN